MFSTGSSPPGSSFPQTEGGRENAAFARVFSPGEVPGRGMGMDETPRYRINVDITELHEQATRIRSKHKHLTLPTIIGIQVMLVIEARDHGGVLKGSELMMAKRADCTVRQLRVVRDALWTKTGPDTWEDRRVALVLARAKTISEVKRNAGKKGGRGRTREKHMLSDPKAHALAGKHMLSEAGKPQISAKNTRLPRARAEEIYSSSGTSVEVDNNPSLLVGATSSKLSSPPISEKLRSDPVAQSIIEVIMDGGRLPDPPKKTPTVLPPKWEPDGPEFDIAKRLGLTIEEAQHIGNEFATYWHVTGKKKSNWLATWRTWCQKEAQKKRGREALRKLRPTTGGGGEVKTKVL